MQKIILATRNPGKIAELSGPLSAFGHEVTGLDSFPDLPEVEETGKDFAENALLKARAIAKATGLMAIADDSGLEVEALHGAPGVFSARYADDLPLLEGETRDARNIRKLLREMRKIPRGQRQARFVTVMAACKPDGEYIMAQGEWPGVILLSPLGRNGFGYDPVFWDASLERSAAQLSREEKNAVSHRGKAVAALLKQLPAFLK